MKVLWKADLGQGKHDPLEVTHVITKSGSQISAELVVPLDPHTPPVIHADEQLLLQTAGLYEVIDAQMAAIDDLAKANKALEDAVGEAEAQGVDPVAHTALKEWADQFPVLVEELCMALGFARNPVGPTGIPELDRIVGLAR